MIAAGAEAEGQAMKHLLVFASLVVLLCGCATEHYVTDARHPEVSITESGGVTYRGKFVKPEDLPGLLKDSGLTKRDTIRIHVPDNLHDMQLPGRVYEILLRNGFTRSILLSDRKSYVDVGLTPEDRRRQQLRQQPVEQVDRPPARRTIRYK